MLDEKKHSMELVRTVCIADRHTVSYLIKGCKSLII